MAKNQIRGIKAWGKPYKCNICEAMGELCLSHSYSYLQNNFKDLRKSDEAMQQTVVRDEENNWIRKSDCKLRGVAGWYLVPPTVGINQLKVPLLNFSEKGWNVRQSFQIDDNE